MTSCDTLAAELRRERGGVRRVGDVEVERRAEEREPREQIGAPLLDERAQPFGDQLRRRGLGQAEQVVEQPPERRVRGGGLVRVARDDERLHVAGAGAQLLDQPALADARVADELDHAAVPAWSASSASLNVGDLVVAADEREVRDVRSRPGAATAPTANAWTGWRLPFT